MGDIRTILARVETPQTDGWNPCAESYCLPFTVELREDFHIHWQDIRLEIRPEDFEKLVTALNRAYELWCADGKPKTQKKMVRYGWWPGEEQYDFGRDRGARLNRENETCHHFSLFPRTEGGALYFDTVLQIELQARGQYHIHYKNFRWELGSRTFLLLADAFRKAARRHRRLKWIDAIRRPVLQVGRLAKRVLAKLVRTMLRRGFLGPWQRPQAGRSDHHT